MNPIHCDTRSARSIPADLALAAAVLVLGACSSVGNTPSAPGVLAPERVAEILASPDRSAADRINDQRRKPYQMLNFIGLRPGMVALDVSAGGGYTTELLARSIGPSGRVYGQNAPRVARSASAEPEGGAAPPPGATPRPTAVTLAERAKNPLASSIVPVVRPFEDPAPAEVASNGLDLVTLMFNYHDLGHLGVDRAA
jgi:hypothetical protein